MVRVEKPSLGPGKIIEQLAPWETFQVLGPHSGVDICDSIMIKRYVTMSISLSTGVLGLRSSIGQPCKELIRDFVGIFSS